MAISTSSLTVDSDMYMQLLVAQLKNQDPMEPMSNTEMITQMSQLATVDGINKLGTTFSEVLELQQLQHATSLVGSEVEYSTESGTQQGVVESVRRFDDAITLTVGGVDVTMDEITRIF
jgi:flagellar basal-body rod modification protein FlgD